MSAVFCYDANGNMTQKIDGSSTNYTYDAENRMTAVSGAATATFVYDGDGNRVKGVVGGVTTTYIGNYFEPLQGRWTGSTSTMKKYYYAGGSRVAERKGTTLYWLLSDHLGSTSITATSSGSKTAELRYKAWGETRYTYGTTQTTIRYTGQREESSLGLYWYASRWYSPGLGRFVSPDSIIPQPGSPLAWDRYSYTNNSPIRYTDPSGNTPLIVTALLGAVISFSASYVVQTISNINDGMQFTEAAKWSNMDKKTLTVAAVGGFVSGLTMGATSLVIGGTQGFTVAGEVLYSTFSGAVSNTAAGQAEALTNAVIDNFEDSTTLISTSDGRQVIHFDPNFEGFWDEAAGYGFGDWSVISNDAISGAFVGGITSGLNIAMKDLGTPDIAYLGKNPSPFIRPLSKAVDYLGELLLQQ
jgi:RHS repeat-associated protein